MHLFRSLLILLVLSGCSHDLGEIPRIDAGDESDADAADATLSRQDGAVTDAAIADSRSADVSEDASASPQQGFIVELAASASINGVASEGQDLILAGKSGDHSLVVRVDSTGPGASGSGSWANRYRHPERPTELLGAAADSSQIVAVGTLITSDPDGRSNGWILFLDGEGESNEGYEVEMESSLRLHAVALSSSMYVAVGTHQSEQGVIVAGDLARLSPPKIVRVNAGANIELQTVVAGDSDSTFYFGGSIGEHGLVARMELDPSDAPIIQVWSQRLLSGLTSADALALRSDPEASLLASGPGGSFFAFEAADGRPTGARGSLFTDVHSIAADGPNQWVNGVTSDFPRAGERNNMGAISYTAWEGGNLMALRTALALAGDTWFQVLGSTTSDRLFHVLPVDGGCGARSERDSSAMEEFPTLDSTITLTLTESFASDPIPVETESAGVDWRPCSGE